MISKYKSEQLLWAREQLQMLRVGQNSCKCFSYKSKIGGRALHQGYLHQATVQQALRVKWHVFGVFVCFGLYFVNYRSWQAEILQERAEGCIQVDLQKEIRQDKNNAFLFCGFVGVVFGHKFKVV